jgi:hypothetical protein
MTTHRPDVCFDAAATEASVGPDVPVAWMAGEHWMPADQVIWITLAMLAATLAAAFT